MVREGQANHGNMCHRVALPRHLQQHHLPVIVQKLPLPGRNAFNAPTRSLAETSCTSQSCISFSTFGSFLRRILRVRLIDVERPECPPDPDATAEAYLTGGLSQQEIAAYEEHYLGCPCCAERLQFIENFVLALRRAAERLHLDKHSRRRGQMQDTACSRMKGRPQLV